MVILIAGASHTGKTTLAQTLLERYRYPVLSLDLLKMGLIRSGQTDLTPEDDEQLAPYLWSIASEMAKTAIENRQNLIIEGCYIPFDWRNDVPEAYLDDVEYCCLVLSRRYLEGHWDDVLAFANATERRLHDDVSFEELARDNEAALAACRAEGLNYVLVDDAYDVASWRVAPLSAEEAQTAARLFRRTVHAVNARDYSPEQIDAWAPEDDAYRQALADKLARQRTVGVRECGILIGFGSLDEAGNVDMLYVHEDRQRQGIGRRIVEELERLAAADGSRVIGAFASITARPFFKRLGYAIVRENAVVRRGVSLENFYMEKSLERA